jgi:hypothetical protein
LSFSLRPNFSDFFNLDRYGFGGSFHILGSGFCRIDASREDLFREILLSFLAASRDAKFCKSLTIVLYFRDVAEMNINLEAINDFTKFYTSNFSRESRGLVTGNLGQPVM